MSEEQKNKVGLSLADYRGGDSTLCLGCGHNAITNQIVTAFYESSIHPWDIVKFSGIGCSSKTPAYFLGSTQGFNTVHGRMPSVATGTLLANRKLLGIGVSGDGDSANIGLGQFCHLFRRNLPLIYVCENNGVYGLTKGQFSATSDMGAVHKNKSINRYDSIDLCSLAIEMGCTYVARSFAGDMQQVLTLLKGALSHKGAVFLDIVSPCVTFNNHADSTKSYPWGKAHEQLLHLIDYIPPQIPITVKDHKPGEAKAIELHDGSKIVLRKAETDYDPTNRGKALDMLSRCKDNGELFTGLVYFEKDRPDLCEVENIVDTPLSQLDIKDLRPSKAQWNEIMSGF